MKIPANTRLLEDIDLSTNQLIGENHKLDDLEGKHFIVERVLGRIPMAWNHVWRVQVMLGDKRYFAESKQLVMG